MKAPPFNSLPGPRNAAENGRKGALALHERRRKEKELLARFTAIAPDDDRVTTTKAQLDAVDMRLNAAISRGNVLLMDALADIKKKLWPLVQPTQGASRPRGKSSRPAAPTAT